MLFWENLLRYPRFFISSMIGLILILLNPIIMYLKNFKNTKLVIIILVTFSIILFWVLKTMLTIE
uniref:Uncharacterized protein ycf33 n=1 Tax=Protohalopteris sp. TaxID=2843287 RepID=A0A8F0F7F6_9PHAE|nr:hypothetical protein [Protohalopteris sp.]